MIMIVQVYVAVNPVIDYADARAVLWPARGLRGEFPGYSPGIVDSTS